jgi:uncharacterized protein (TIGR03089 family)
MTTLGALLSTAVARDATRPLLTFYDDGTGERAELSGATLANWVAKTANLLVDGVGAQPGEVALVALPPHWQTAAVLLGAWSAGMITTPVPLPSGVTVAFLGTEGVAPDPVVTAERYVLPAGYVDFNSEVRGHGDRFVPVAPVTQDAAAVPGSTHRELVARAGARAAELGIGTGDRVLISAEAYPEFLDWLLAPLAAGASIVLCGQPDPDRMTKRAVAERVTVTLS